MIADGSLPHQLIITGISGIGKSTIAKIIAQELQAPFILFNVADLTGIDNVREYIIQEYKKNPIGHSSKVFILDEIHKFSQPAQECLLTPLEENSNTYFIACTTEPEKIKSTLRKRFTEIRLLPPSSIDRMQLLNQLPYIVHQDVKDYIVEITIDLRTVKNLANLCNGISLEEAKILCVSYHESKQAIDIIKSLLTISNIDNYLELLKQYGNSDGNWSSFLHTLINYYSVVLMNKRSEIAKGLKAYKTLSELTKPIQIGCEKARVYYLSYLIFLTLKGG
uniref:Putative DNA polymerase n=1 Tax=viral metagenome TaxID=1070528 RepID=A0A6M3JS25_9ZZZZ